jgi:transcriptional regulator with XRE-family HTH domain
MPAVIGDRIGASRRGKGMTQVELALALGIHPHTISYYERNDWPVPAKRLAQIAEALDDPSLLEASDNPETLRVNGKEISTGN